MNIEPANTVWVVGDVAWDTVVYLETYPQPGTFTRAQRREERPGGSAGNVAQALASAGGPVGFVTELGRDDLGRHMHASLTSSDISDLRVSWTDGATQHLVVLVHDHGDRTLISIAGGGSRLRLDDVPIVERDIVVFVAWDPVYIEALEYARSRGCFTVVGLAALGDANVTHANLAFGSQSDVGGALDPRSHFDRFDAVVVTGGASGATYYSPNGSVHQPALPARIVDTTGAGDAFLSGYLAMLSQNRPPEVALAAGARWAAAAVSVEASVPPRWEHVPRLN